MCFVVVFVCGYLICCVWGSNWLYLNVLLLLNDVCLFGWLYDCVVDDVIVCVILVDNVVVFYGFEMDM